MGNIHIDVSKDSSNTMIFFRSYSYYDENTKERIINKKDVSCRKIADVATTSKSTVSRELTKYINNGVIIDKGTYYVIQEPHGSYVSLEEKFVKRLIKTFGSDYVKVYIWLYRRYGYKKSLGQECKFTKGQICVEALGLTDQDKNREKVQNILYQLALNGLISYSVRREGKTFLRVLNSIRTEFIVVDAAIAKEKSIIGEVEIEANELVDSSSMTGQDVLSIGYNENLLLAE